MKITPIKALNDNYIWMIQEGNHAACVDPSDATPVLKFLVHNRLMLAQTWITHPHASNLRFAQHIEPDNIDIQTALAAAEHTPTLPVSLAHERKVNPFFRVHLPQVQARAEELSGRKLNSELEVFAALRELKNQF